MLPATSDVESQTISRLMDYQHAMKGFTLPRQVSHFLDITLVTGP